MTCHKFFIEISQIMTKKCSMFGQLKIYRFTTDIKNFFGFSDYYVNDTKRSG